MAKAVLLPLPACRKLPELLAAALLFLAVGWAISAQVHVIEPLAAVQPGAPSHWRISDFTIIDTAAQLVRREPVRLYRLEAQHDVQVRRLGVEMQDTLPFIYPPYVALALFALPGLPIETEYHGWILLSALLSLGLVVLLLRAASAASGGAFLAAALLLVTFLPWLNATASGQLIVIPALGLTGAWLLAGAGFPASAGALVVFTAIKPQVMMLPALYLVMLGGRRAFLGAAIAALSLIALSTAVFGPGIWRDYFSLLHLMAHEDGRYGLDNCAMVDMRALLHCRFHLPLGQANLASAGAMAFGLAVTGWLGWRARSRGKDFRAFAFALTLPLATLISPLVHLPTLVLLCLPAMFLAGSSRRLLMLLSIHIAYMLAYLAFPASLPLSSLALQLFLLGWAALSLAACRKEMPG